MKNKQIFKKIKYTFSIMRLETMTMDKTVYEIYPDGRVTKTDTKGTDADKKISKKKYQLSPKLLNKFISDVMDVVHEANWNNWGPMIDDAGGTLEITFVGNAMKLVVDRSVGNENVWIDKLIDSLLNNLKEV